MLSRKTPRSVRDSFATFVAVLRQEASDELELLSAGHGGRSSCIPLIPSPSAFLEAQALPLGIFPDLWEAVPVRWRMQPGDIVILMTDGCFEWENKGWGTVRNRAPCCGCSTI